jgi:hypothetical protein
LTLVDPKLDMDEALLFAGMMDEMGSALIGS